MLKKKFVKIFFSFLFFIVGALLIYSKFYKNTNNDQIKEENTDKIYNSNIIKNVEYTTRDKKGNEYFIKAQEGEIDFSNSNIIFLKKVYAIIKLIDSSSEEITIVSEFGKYNSENYDTIFSKNVKINYIDNEITGDYLDFSIERNSMIISKNVIYNNLDNILKADVIDINIKTKDTKIFMYEKEQKVSIKSKN